MARQGTQGSRSRARARGLVRRIALAGLAAALLALPGCGDLWRVLFPSSDHDEVAPTLPEDLAEPAVLVFSKTNGYRHDEAIAAGLPLFERLARERGWGYFATENGAVHAPEILERFDVLVWFQVSGNVLAEEQRAALRGWIEAGGAFFGIHGTGGDASYDWAWHPETLVGAQFVGHPMGPQFQEATIRIEAPEHPVMEGLPRVWTRVEEWYSFAESPRGEGVRVLANLDESTYSPRMKIAVIDRDLRMGEDHPIVWTHCIGRGRAIYSALGHQAAAYEEPAHVKLLENGLRWLMGRSRSGGRCDVD